VALGGKFYVIGGRLEAGFESAMTAVVEVYDPATNQWSNRAPLPRPRGGLNAVVAHGYIHTLGGEGTDDTPTGVFPDHDVYDPSRNLWIKLPPMPMPVHGVTGASFINGLIHLTGGGVMEGGASGDTMHQVFRPATSYR
jgi:N-acetylneuraminic acid mutarotase